MKQTPAVPTRRENETDKQWDRRLNRYVTQNTPKDERQYVWVLGNGKPWHRFIIPGLYYLAGIITLIALLSIVNDYRMLNGSQSTFGNFKVTSLNETKNDGKTTYTPNVIVRDSETKVYNSAFHQFDEGTEVALKYTTEGKKLAGFANDDGVVAIAPGFQYIFIVPIAFIFAGIFVQFFYKGRTNFKYRQAALEELKKKSKSTK